MTTGIVGLIQGSRSAAPIRLGSATHVCSLPVSYSGSAGWIYETERRPVRVMAVAEGYAMVRRKGAMPYVCSCKEIVQP